MPILQEGGGRNYFPVVNGTNNAFHAEHHFFVSPAPGAVAYHQSFSAEKG